MDDDYMPRPDDKKSLKFVIRGLPFYLSNADYNPTLAELSRSVLGQNMGKKLPEFRVEIKLLHAAINLYLKKDPARAGIIMRAITALNRVVHLR
ncbi:hypothetical protein GALMADRAFT_252995 [Galerina marginata CBS 339.88]|uniref:Uncharacterized protein n=1 Tax=Galerina marginata (strain CBS 339.88) TaxID=685588 RepID=A0A067SMJ6_GALM3|nr:hypothetical protein GALMADRAFT_252995 [Galerina marginata CBS 339.88]